MKYYFFSIAFLISLSCKPQQVSTSNHIENPKETTNEKPKLVVGIVVDQMRYDYLTRFQDKYGTGGFMRMIGEGFNCKNNHFNYVPTYTGPGHASVYTGTTPKYHGIIANDWYDKVSKKMVYCAEDDLVMPIGTTSDAGKMSPHRMRTTTFGDENRLFTQMRGKTIGISIKDRGAILPAGHTANAAYWFLGGNEGNFISSSFYMDKLPTWVEQFNASGKVHSYLTTWSTLYDINSYNESGSDLNDFEGKFKGKETATFPYDLSSLSVENGNFDIIKATPYGNSIIVDFAIAALRGEQLGKDNDTDILAVSFSSTDYVGHKFGVNSKEVEDTYIRLDKDLERFFKVLDAEVGKDNYVVFLTADHAAVEVPAYLASVHIPAGYIESKEGKERFMDFLTSKFGAKDIVENVSNNQVFLNYEKLTELGLDLDDVEEAIVQEIITYEHMYKAYTAQSMNSVSFTSGIERLLQNGYDQKRSGDVLYAYEPAFISYSKTGSTHGSGFSYDTHVPLLFMGKGIVHGSTLERTEITDIAPTICAILDIAFPNGTYGNPLEFVLRK